jgi:hypothetical protein
MEVTGYGISTGRPYSKGELPESESPMKRLALPVLLLLSACGTPQEQCISGVTSNIQVLDSLIAQSEANIARGYAYQESVTFVPQLQFCGWGGGWGGGWGTVGGAGTQMCWVDQPISSQQPVAIDLQAEQAKLNGLKQKRAQQAKAVAPAIAQCKAQYPQ